MTARRRTLRCAAALVTAVGVLTASACAPAVEGHSGNGSDPASRVQVDTPALRTLKQAAGVEACRPGHGAPVSEGLADLTLPCLGGGPDVDLSALRGPMVVNLWAQWCTPCRTELPIYERLHEEAGDRLKVLGIDYQDTQPKAALELVRDSGVTYPLLADPGSLLEAAYHLRGLPFVLFVDSRGRVTEQQYVAIDSYDQLRDLVAEHLGIRL